MRDGKYIVAITGATVNSLTATRLHGFFRQYNPEMVHFKIKETRTTYRFSKYCQTCLESQGIEFSVIKLDQHLSLNKRYRDQNDRLLLLTDLLIMMTKDRLLQQQASDLNIQTLVLRTKW